MDDQKTLIERASGTIEKPTSWHTAVFLSIAAVFVVGVVTFFVFLNRRNRTAAAHKLDVLENTLRQRKDVYDKLDVSDKHRFDLEREIETLRKERERTDAHIKDLDTGCQRFKEKLSSIHSWDDVL